MRTNLWYESERISSTLARYLTYWCIKQYICMIFVMHIIHVLLVSDTLLSKLSNGMLKINKFDYMYKGYKNKSKFGIFNFSQIIST